MADARQAGALRKDVGLLGVITLGAGTAIGVSIFSILQPTAQVAGSALLLGIFIAIIPMVLFAISYSYLGSILPVSGASYEWPSRFLHPLVGFAIAWMRIVANVGALTILSQVLISYLGMVVDLPLKPSMAVATTLVFGLNYLGVSVAARLQSFLMIFLLVVLAVFVGSGLPSVRVDLIGSPLIHGAWPALAVVPLLISLFLGIESAVEIGEEIRNPQRNIPLGIMLACGLTAVVYAAVAFTALGLIGPAALARSSAPLFEAAQVSLGVWAKPLIVGAAAASIFKSMNAAALIFSRSLFAMARSGALPEGLAAIHPRFGTPHRAILVAYVAAMSGLLLPPSLVFLILAVNVPTMLKYMACSLSAARASQHPKLHEKAPLRMSAGFVRLISYLGAFSALAITIFGLESDPRPYALIAGWLGVGLVYWWLKGRFACTGVD